MVWSQKFKSVKLVVNSVMLRLLMFTLKNLRGSVYPQILTDLDRLSPNLRQVDPKEHFFQTALLQTHSYNFLFNSPEIKAHVFILFLSHFLSSPDNISRNWLILPHSPLL